MFEVNELVKNFDTTQAVDGFGLKAKPGEIQGLLGPNGAGKTTIIRMIMNILKPDLGEIYYNNEPRNKLKRSLFGYLPEERGLYQRATVMKMLIYFAMLNGLSKHRAEVEAIRLLDRLGLIEYTQSRILELSKGMQQKIQFISAILHDPEILILDEPFAGLDPVNQIVLRNIVEKFKDQGKIVILSTHQMDDVERLCDKISLINQGKVVYQGSLDALKKQFRQNAYYLETEDDLTFIHDLDFIEVLEEHNQSCKFILKSKNGSLRKLLDTVFQNTTLKKFMQVEPTLHDIFIKLIQR
jgi:ABC-2 type transport system ATP-binding protein